MRRRSTAPGQHRAVMLEEVLRVLDPQPGQVILDCTIGFAGHAVELIKRVGPEGKLIGLDLDAEHLSRAREQLEKTGHPFTLHHANFAGAWQVLGAENIPGVHGLVADLGMSSMQVDDPERGFSYVRDGALDMRMDRSRGKSAAQVLSEISEPELAGALSELADEPQAETIAHAIIIARRKKPIERTRELAEIVMQAVGASQWRLHPSRKKWMTHPAARTFQALRLLVNRELGSLGNLLRTLPQLLAPAGRAALISFHSGEDRLVKNAFRTGLQTGIYAEIADEPLRPSWSERQANPRSRSAKLRWAQRTA